MKNLAKMSRFPANCVKKIYPYLKIGQSNFPVQIFGQKKTILIVKLFRIITIKYKKFYFKKNMQRDLDITILRGMGGIFFTVGKITRHLYLGRVSRNCKGKNTVLY